MLSHFIGRLPSPEECTTAECFGKVAIISKTCLRKASNVNVIAGYIICVCVCTKCIPEVLRLFSGKIYSNFKDDPSKKIL